MGAESRADLAFDAYLELGPGRSIARLAEVLAGRLKQPPSIRTLESWSARFRWQERIRELEEEARTRAEEERIEWIQEYRRRLRDEGLVLQRKGLEWLREKSNQEVRTHEAIRAIEVGFKLEALALGEAAERIVHEEEQTDARLERLTDEELDALIEAGRHRLDERGGKA